MARLTKYEIACMIERLPGNKPWGLYSLMTIYCDHYTRGELVYIYNGLVQDRKLNLPSIA